MILFPVIDTKINSYNLVAYNNIVCTFYYEHNGLRRLLTGSVHQEEG
jgi:hypothetical protein